MLQLKEKYHEWNFEYIVQLKKSYCRLKRSTFKGMRGDNLASCQKPKSV